MNVTNCETVRERIPAMVRGEVAADERATLDAHLAGCAGCRDELELVTLLGRAVPRPPEGLSARISEAVRADAGRARTRPGSSRPWWGLAAAAVAALALGIGVNSRDHAAETAQIPAYAQNVDTDQQMWLNDDGLIAGAPALDDLSEDDLTTLLAEMTVGGQA